MAKHIFNRSSELDLEPSGLFESKKEVIQGDTIDYCMHEAISKGDIEIFEWTRSVSKTKLSHDQIKKYFTIFVALIWQGA